jgi:hypothetical protein
MAPITRRPQPIHGGDVDLFRRHHRLERAFCFVTTTL